MFYSHLRITRFWVMSQTVLNLCVHPQLERRSKWKCETPGTGCTSASITHWLPVNTQWASPGEASQSRAGRIPAPPLASLSSSIIKLKPSDGVVCITAPLKWRWETKQVFRRWGPGARVWRLAWWENLLILWSKLSALKLELWVRL